MSKPKILIEYDEYNFTSAANEEAYKEWLIEEGRGDNGDSKQEFFNRNCEGFSESDGNNFVNVPGLENKKAIFYDCDSQIKNWANAEEFLENTIQGEYDDFNALVSAFANFVANEFTLDIRETDRGTEIWACVYNCSFKSDYRENGVIVDKDITNDELAELLENFGNAQACKPRIKIKETFLREWEEN